MSGTPDSGVGEIFACGIQNLGKVCTWNPASWALESVVHLELSGILQTNWNPESKFHRQGIRTSGAWNPEATATTVENREFWTWLDYLAWGEADLDKSGAPNEGFLLNTLKTLFRLSRVLLDLSKCIINGAIKFVSAQPAFWGELESFSKLHGLQYYFSENSSFNFWRITKVRIFLIPLSITFLNPKISGFLFLRKIA